jgi:hypothetical protein
LLVLPLPAQVNREELEQGQTPLSFINYEGPHARIETLAQIREIGYALGRAVRGGNNTPGTRGRYFAIHLAEAGDGAGLSADIFGLGYDTGVDHIRNLRLILQGYLEGAYLYTAQDAALLAEYVTVYNAVYRGDWDYIGSRYREAVTGQLDRERAGLSIRFDEWPGRTLIVIPTGRGEAGSLSALDTSVVSDDRVVEEFRKDEGRGVESRQDMVELKEREAGEAEQRAQERRREADEEQRQIDEERRQIEEERRQIAQAQPPAQPPQQPQPEPPPGAQPPAQPQSRQETPPPARPPRQPEPAPEPPQGAGEPAREAEPVTAEESPQTEQETELARREEDLDRRQEEADRKQEEARRDEEFAGQKREEAREDREGIAADQQALIDEGSPREEEGGLVTVILNGPDSPLGRFALIDQEGKELRRSTVNTVNARTVIAAGGRIIAVAGENRGAGAVRLIEVDSRTLEMKAQGDDDIHPQSLLWTNGSDLYAVTVSGGDAYLGRFNPALARQARSQASLHPLASLWFQDGLVLTQRPDGSALVLDAQTLGER